MRIRKCSVAQQTVFYSVKHLSVDIFNVLITQFRAIQMIRDTRIDKMSQELYFLLKLLIYKLCGEQSHL